MSCYWLETRFDKLTKEIPSRLAPNNTNPALILPGLPQPWTRKLHLTIIVLSSYCPFAVPLAKERSTPEKAGEARSGKSPEGQDTLQNPDFRDLANLEGGS